MLRLALIAGLLLSAGAAVAQPIGPLVHVRSTQADGTVSHGSGVALGGDLVLTARHVLTCGVFDAVQRGDGEQLPARPIHGDPGLDLALLRVPGLRAPPLALAPPDAPATATVLGIRSSVEGAPLRWLDGLSVGLEVRRSPGDSGGPVLHGSALLGVVTGAADGSLGQGLAIGPGPAAISGFLGAPRRRPCSPRGRLVAAALSDAQHGANPERALLQLAALRPTGSDSLARAVGSRRARLLVLLDRPVEARRELDGVLAREPDNARARLDRVRVTLLAGDAPEWEELAAVAAHPESGVLLRMVADWADHEGRPAEGIEVVDRLIAQHGALPHLLAARCRARTLFGDLAGAQADCERAIGAGTRPLWALVDLAALQLSLRRPTKALALLDEAATRADGATILLLRASARLASLSPFEEPGAGDASPLRAALRDAEAALRSSDGAAWTVGPAWFLRGVAEWLLGDLDAAVASAIAAAEASPGEARIRALAQALDAGAPILGIDGTGHLEIGQAP